MFCTALSCDTNSDSASRPDKFSSSDRDSDVSGSVSSDNITKHKVIRPHTCTSDPFLHKYSSPVDPQESKSDDDRQEGTVNDTVKTPLSTPVDADDHLCKQDKEIDQTDVAFGEVETPATITANANKPESFATMLPQQQENHSMEDTEGPYTSDALHNHTLTTKPPVLPEITRDADDPPDHDDTRDNVPSNVSDDEDEKNHTAANVKQQHHWYQHTKGEEEQVAVSPEIQDRAALQVRTVPPTQPTTDGLCTGISQSRLVASPTHSSMATVLWVHPQSPLVCIRVYSLGYNNIGGKCKFGD